MEHTEPIPCYVVVHLYLVSTFSHFHHCLFCLYIMILKEGNISLPHFSVGLGSIFFHLRVNSIMELALLSKEKGSKYSNYYV